MYEKKLLQKKFESLRYFWSPFDIHWMFCSQVCILTFQKICHLTISKITNKFSKHSILYLHQSPPTKATLIFMTFFFLLFFIRLQNLYFSDRHGHWVGKFITSNINCANIAYDRAASKLFFSLALFLCKKKFHAFWQPTNFFFVAVVSLEKCLKAHPSMKGKIPFPKL